MRVLILACLLAVSVGCSFSATTKGVDLQSTPSVASYDIDLRVVKSSGSVDIPMGDKIAAWVSGVIGEAKGLLSKLDPAADAESD